MADEVQLAHAVIELEQTVAALRERVLALVNAPALAEWAAAHPGASEAEQAYAAAWMRAADHRLPLPDGLAEADAGAIRRWFRAHGAGPPI